MALYAFHSKIPIPLAIKAKLHANDWDEWRDTQEKVQCHLPPMRKCQLSTFFLSTFNHFSFLFTIELKHNYTTPIPFQVHGLSFLNYYYMSVFLCVNVCICMHLPVYVWLHINMQCWIRFVVLLHDSLQLTILDWMTIQVVILGEAYFSHSWQCLVFYSSSPCGGAPSDVPHPHWPAIWGCYRGQVFFRPDLEGLSQVDTDDVMKMATVWLRGLRLMQVVKCLLLNIPRNFASVIADPSVSFHMPQLSSTPPHVTLLFPCEEHLVSTYYVPGFCCPRKMGGNNHMSDFDSLSVSEVPEKNPYLFPPNAGTVTQKSII